MHKILREGDVFVFDRRFRNVKEKLDYENFFLDVYSKRQHFWKNFHYDDDTFDEILQGMHNQKEVQNILATEVKENGWLRRRLPLKSVTSDDILFIPEMAERDLKILFSDSY